MNTPSPSVTPDEELKTTKTKLATINSLVGEAMTEIDAWLEAEDRKHSLEAGVMHVHANKLHTHSAALAEWITGLGTPLRGRLLLLSGASRIPGSVEPDKVVETKDAYDQQKINTLSASDIRDALEFNTEFKDTFGFASMDEEVSTPLGDALHLLLDMLEDSAATLPGMVVSVLKVLLKGHPRGFGRYYSGTDPWPRPSAEIQAEIDTRMPDALDWLRYELKEALEEEARRANETP